MKLQESGEMYLETIYVLSKELPAVRSIDVGEYMGFSKPSVSRAVGLLKENGKLPSFLLSMGNRFDYKNIYFSFLLNGVFGQTKELHDYNFDRWMPTYNYISGMDYWTPENPTNEMTSPAYVPYDKHSFYKKMNYVNIKNITIGYTFPKTTLSAIGISSLSINASVNNLYTFSNIDNWLNLEDSDANRNVLVTYPTARSYMFGLNLTF